MPLGSTLLYAAFTIVVWTLGEMLALPMLNVLVAGRASPGNRGRYMGVYTMAFAAAFVFAPAVGTHVYETYGADILWYGVGALAPLLGIAAVALRRPFRSAEA